MRFITLEKHEAFDPSARDVAFLSYSDWDDWFEFETKHILIYVDAEGRVNRIGAVKIGRIGQTERRAELPRSFTELDDQFFTLGQDEDYYKTISSLPISETFFKNFRDIAYNLEIYDNIKDEKVARVSLFRTVDKDRITKRFHRLSKGNAELSRYEFSYTFPQRIDIDDIDRKTLNFVVEPESVPPTNVHVLIGRNGVGKTTCMTNMIRSYLGIAAESSGDFSVESDFGSDNFSNIVSVTFSAFDPFFSSSKNSDKYQYVGLKRDLRKAETEFYEENKSFTKPDYILKNINDLSGEFIESGLICRKGVKQKRWMKSLETLSSDPLFAESEVITLCDHSIDEEMWREEATDIFGGLSSGHKIVLLTITKLVELVQEQSLVLLDEPEGHLHPPLLSAFVRALSELLIDQNGVAIIATHSPVVLQEVPKTCVWVLNRAGRTVEADRPLIETFGENVGALTHEIFGLEVTDTGFYKMISDLLASGKTANEILALFSDQIGSEGQAIAGALEFMRSQKVGDAESA